MEELYSNCFWYGRKLGRRQGKLGQPSDHDGSLTLDGRERERRLDGGLRLPCSLRKVWQSRWRVFEL